MKKLLTLALPLAVLAVFVGLGTTQQNAQTGRVQRGGCNLQIKQELKSGPFVSGQQATVTMTVTNLGNTPGAICPAPTTVTDILPEGLTLASASGSGWVCKGPVCTYQSPIPAGASVSLSYTLNVTATPGARVTNCATVTNLAPGVAVTLRV